MAEQVPQVMEVNTNMATNCYVCRHCGCSNPDVLLYCRVCGQFYCNIIANRGYTTHIFHHMQQSGHSALTLCNTNPLGELQLSCSFCYDSDIFKLGFLISHSDTQLWRLACSMCAERRDGNYGWAISKWKSVLENKGLIDVLVKTEDWHGHNPDNISEDKIRKNEFDDKYMEATVFGEYEGGTEPMQASAIKNCPEKNPQAIKHQRPLRRRLGPISNDLDTQYEDSRMFGQTSNQANQSQPQVPEFTRERRSIPTTGVFENRWHYQNAIAPLLEDECTAAWEARIVGAIDAVEIHWEGVHFEIGQINLPSYIWSKISYATSILVSTKFLHKVATILSLYQHGKTHRLTFRLYSDPGWEHLKFVEETHICKGKVVFNNVPLEIIRQLKVYKSFGRRTNPDMHPYFYALLLGKDWLLPRQVDDPLSSDQIKMHIQPLLCRLNDKQKDAVFHADSHLATIICGPPGTGKTMVAATLAFVLWKHANLTNREAPIIVTAPTNIAVMNVVYRCIDFSSSFDELSKVRLVCVSATEHEQDWMESGSPYTLEYKIRAFAKEVSKEQATSSRLSNSSGLDFSKLHEMYEWEDAKQWTKIDFEEFDKLKRAAARKILRNSDIVFTTCGSALSKYMKPINFGTVIVDEATQATEAQTFVFMTKGLKRLILIGDEHQLGPMVFNMQAAKNGFGHSFYERIMHLIPPQNLIEQYRMPADIMMWPNEAFYNGILRVATFETSSVPLDLSILGGPANKHICFMDVYGRETGVSGTMSFVNKAEALRVVDIVRELLEGNNKLTGEDIGIITPYLEQANEIKCVLSRTGSKYVASDIIEVKTVDGFQGREKKVVIISVVRCNAQNSLGFVVDPRRINVSLTRAKMLCIVVGSALKLSQNDLWAKFIGFCMERNVLFHRKGQQLCQGLTGWVAQKIGAGLRNNRRVNQKRLPSYRDHRWKCVADQADQTTSGDIIKVGLPGFSEIDLRSWEREQPGSSKKVYDPTIDYQDRFVEHRPISRILRPVIFSGDKSDLIHRAYRKDNKLSSICLLHPYAVNVMFEGEFQVPRLDKNEWEEDLDQDKVNILISAMGDRAVFNLFNIRLLWRKDHGESITHSKDRRFFLKEFLFEEHQGDKNEKMTRRSLPQCYCLKDATSLETKDGNIFFSCHSWSDNVKNGDKKVCLFAMTKTMYVTLQDQADHAKGNRPTPQMLCSTTPQNSQEALTLSTIGNVISNWTVSTFPFQIYCDCIPHNPVTMKLVVGKVAGKVGGPVIRWMLICPEWCGKGNILASARIQIPESIKTPLEIDAKWMASQNS